jgi:hypothetical protein
VEVLRLYNPDRRPSNWIDIVRSGQFVAFAKLVASDASCDAEGEPFAAPEAATCLVFDSLTEASRFCSERVQRIASLRFDIFDSAGRTEPPLLVVVHPSREHTLEGNPRTKRVRTVLACGLIVLALPLILMDYWWPDVTLGLAAFLGISLLVGGARLVFLNAGSREADRVRRERLSKYTD